MRLEKRFVLIPVIISLFLLCSCVKGGSDLKIETSPPDKSLIDLASKIYNKQQLSEIAKFNGSIDELNTQYPIECLRDDNDTYRVSYLGDGSIAVLLFDNCGNRLFGNIYNTQLLKSDLDKLEKGQLLEEVRKIDPDGEYLFLYTGRNDTPKVSSHYTKDGYLITIEYDDSNIIVDVHQTYI